MFHSDNKNCPIFVNYHKEEDISETTKYEDKFTDASTLEYMSKSNRKLSSPDVIKFSEAKEKETRIPLFVKKKNIEGDDFYYMGDLVSDPKKFIQTTIKDKKKRKQSQCCKNDFLFEKTCRKRHV